MSHLHIPDGVLPLWLWISGFLLTFFILAIFSLKSDKKTFRKKSPLIAIFTALILIVMSLPIIPPYHLNLIAFSGIILGPFMVTILAFLANLLLALSGHAGITIIGLNTIVLSIEGTTAFCAFKLLNKKFKNIFLCGFFATTIALLVSFCAKIGIVYIGTQDLSHIMHNHHHAQETFSIEKFAAIMLTMGSIGILLESSISGFILQYLSKIKPELINNEPIQD